MTTLRVNEGLNGINFLTGAIQTAFGPFLTVYLTRQGWSQGDIGVALSVGTIAALAFQIPAGIVVDHTHYKRISIAIALALIGVTALVTIVAPNLYAVLATRVLHAFASCLLAPAIAALTLALFGHDQFSERLGVNGRYASLGSAAAAAALGGIAYYLSVRDVFVFTALLTVPALLTLLVFRAGDRVEDDHPALLHPRERREREHRPWHLYHDPTLHVFIACVVLFHFANAAMLPLALNDLSTHVAQSGLVISAAIIVPQIVVATASPWVGHMAQRYGRRPVLQVAFAAVPLRALLFIAYPGAVPLVVLQVLDGVSATVIGLAVPLIAADITRRTGYLNLAIGSFGLAAGLGATASTAVAGWLADSFDVQAAFLALALVGLAALATVWLMMPETRPAAPLSEAPAVAAA